MAEHIRDLIRQTEAWLAFHKAAGRSIEAAARAIRLKALRDALGPSPASLQNGGGHG